LILLTLASYVQQKPLLLLSSDVFDHPEVSSGQPAIDIQGSSVDETRFIRTEESDRSRDVFRSTNSTNWIPTLN
jgi:hypothetical protein